MLQTIKDYIANLPDKDFGTFYQEYVIRMQDEIIESNVTALESQCLGEKSTKEILSGINILTEELNKL